MSFPTLDATSVAPHLALLAPFPADRPAVLAVAVTPGWNVWTVLGALVLVGIAVWFLVIARDLGDDFARFRRRGS